MKLFKEYLLEQQGSWHQAIRDNFFGLSPENHESATSQLRAVYKSARSATKYPRALEQLHNHLVTSGVDTTHPYLREITGLIRDADEMNAQRGVNDGN